MMALKQLFLKKSFQSSLLREFPLVTLKANYTQPSVKSFKLYTKELMRDFDATLPIIFDQERNHPDLSKFEAIGKLEKLKDYFLMSGKNIRAALCIESYILMEKEENLTPTNYRLAYIMGWIIEVLQTHGLVLDDIMDDSVYRRGKECWHREVGMAALTDALFLKQFAFYLLQKHFSSHKMYPEIRDIFYDTSLRSLVGQYGDIGCYQNGLQSFTMPQLRMIAKYKTGYYSISLPVGVGLYMANVKDLLLIERGLKLTLEISEYLQMQDDYIDCYGEKAGKKFSDIRSGACSWLIVKALELANPSQRKILETYYGSKDSNAIEKVFHLYNELQLPELYASEENDIFKSIRTKIEKLENEKLIKLFEKLVTTISFRRR